MEKNWNIETIAVQGGYQPGNGDPRIVPIAQSTTFKYDDAQSVADLFDLKAPGFFYTRLANPTVDALERKIADMCQATGQANFCQAITPGECIRINESHTVRKCDAAK